jgi:LysM repeat protein
MKLIHVTGLVVAVHAAVFVVIFATPGCRSTGRPKPAPEATAPTSVSPVLDSLSPIAVPAESTAVTPVTSLAPVSATPAPADTVIRFAPTRPSLAPIAETPPVPTSATHTVAKGDSLWSISRKYGISLDELAAANQLAKTASLRLGQTLIVPAKAAAPAAGVSGEAFNTYTVASGDTLGSIARKHGTTAAALRTANNLKGDNLRIGQKLVLPGNSIPVSAPASSLPAVESAPAVRPAPVAGEATHTVVPGDTLGSIARKHGVRLGDVATLNSITDPAKIRVGQTLKLPVGAKAAAAQSAASAPAVPAAPAEPAPAPVTPVTPVQPMAVPVIRID